MPGYDSSCLVDSACAANLACHATSDKCVVDDDKECTTMPNCVVDSGCVLNATDDKKYCKVNVGTGQECNDN